MKTIFEGTVTTVSEIINILQKYPPDLPFYYNFNGSINKLQISEIYNYLPPHYNHADVKARCLIIGNKIDEEYDTRK